MNDVNGLKDRIRLNREMSSEDKEALISMIDHHHSLLGEIRELRSEIRESITKVSAAHPAASSALSNLFNLLSRIGI